MAAAAFVEVGFDSFIACSLVMLSVLEAPLIIIKAHE